MKKWGKEGTFEEKNLYPLLYIFLQSSREMSSPGDGFHPFTVSLLSEDREVLLETCAILPVQIHREGVNTRLLPVTVAA